ncbi:hypothetical protein HDEF_0569 [Candidatus Hamiltonella defensa 5AT (Acyrthosiphon pisum)]|uniref:Uncharacterized protein n=1 Tax=Hamiltonella defensa subsp. Acyrthosiphon pisum (strain 5AT) TaxID=572265 RepID=C4K422_HAMD5|nr:hypothetical protein HDEF_0569 [Candidatus Hamiltonella defensa 5AT (Acyrthosiphon pisum)]
MIVVLFQNINDFLLLSEKSLSSDMIFSEKVIYCYQYKTLLFI